MREKILHVCLQCELPPPGERTNDHIYLVYDKLVLLLGNDFYSDPFVIVEKLPEKPISGILYILLSGQVRAYSGGVFELVANIEEDPKQLEALKNLGTTYFIHAAKRYLDPQTRLLMLPYHNGTYMLSVNLAKDLKINEKTVIRYDPETEQFYIDGEHEFEDFRRYLSGESRTASVKVENSCVHADIKLSNDPENILRIIGGGLFASTRGMVSGDEFRKFRNEYYTYKTVLEGYLEEVREAIAEAEVTIDQATIAQKIQEAIESYYGEMVEIFDKYEEILAKVEQDKVEIKEYTDQRFDNALINLTKLINDSVNDQWGEI